MIGDGLRRSTENVAVDVDYGPQQVSSGDYAYFLVKEITLMPLTTLKAYLFCKY